MQLLMKEGFFAGQDDIPLGHSGPDSPVLPASIWPGFKSLSFGDSYFSFLTRKDSRPSELLAWVPKLGF